MQHALLLVIALAGSGWNCTETNGLWDCLPARSVAKVPARTPAPATPATPLAAGMASLPAAPAAAPVEAPAPVPDEAPAAIPDATPAAVLPGKAFVVQVGAYRQRADAEQAAAKLDYESLAIVPTERDGESWWVIVLGAFRTLDSARSVGAEYEAETGGSYWVRTSDDLQEVLADPR